MTQQLSEANERLQLADQQKDDFLSTMTHEIRTSITSIRALTEILHDNYESVDETTRQHFLSTVIKEVERLTQLINQVSGFGTYRIRPVSADARKTDDEQDYR